MQNTENDSSVTKMKLQKGLGVIRKRKQEAWEMVAPNIAHDDRTTNGQGFHTLQNELQEKEDTIDAVCHDNTRNRRDTLSMLYAKATKRQDMNFQDYCRHVCTLNKDQHHIVMYNRAWCKSYINAVRHRENQEGYRICLSGPGGAGKSHVVCLKQRDMSHFFKHTVKPDDDQPIVLITAPTGSAAFQIGGSTIHSYFYYMITLNQNLVGRKEVRCN